MEKDDDDLMDKIESIGRHGFNLGCGIIIIIIGLVFAMISLAMCWSIAKG